MKDRTILITGVAGYLGQKLVKELAKQSWQLIGLDIKSPSLQTQQHLTAFYKLDIRGDIQPIFDEHSIDDVVHLAWTVKPTHDRTTAYTIDIDGTMNVITTAKVNNVKYLLHTSSTLSYGAHPDNPIPLTETDALRGNVDFHYPYHKKIAEEKIQTLLEQDTFSMRIGIIRPTSFLGPDLDNYIVRILQGSWKTFFLLPFPDGDTPIQWTHIDDVVAAYRIMIEKRLEGPFNAGTDQTVTMKEIPTILGGKGIKLPFWLLKTLLRIQWFFRISEAPPSYLNFVKYPFVASIKKLAQHGFEPHFSSKETLESLL